MNLHENRSISMMRVDSLHAHERNSRTHTAKQIKAVAASIKEFGFTNPVLVDELNVIIAGHARVLAAKKLKLKEVPCVILHGLSDLQKRAYLIADNKLALTSDWDLDMLSSELSGLMLEGFDVSLTGFGSDEIAALVEPEEVSQPDFDIPKPKELKITVTCTDTREQEHLFSELSNRGYTCKKN